MKNRIPLPVSPVVLLLAAGLLLSCSRQESTNTATVTTDSVSEATTAQFDSVKDSLEASEERLDDKAKELKEAMEELDTTVVAK